MTRIILHLLKSEDCSSLTFNELVDFIQVNVKSKLFETHTAKPGTKTNFALSGIPSFSEYFAIADAYREEHGIREQDFIFVVSEKINQAGFFCALADGNSRSGFIHAKSWMYTFPDLSSNAEASANAYLIYSLILRRYQYTSDEHATYYEVFSNANFVHRDSKPCFNNWVVEKRKIETLLTSVHICKNCQDLILERGMSTQHYSVIKNLFEKIRENILADDLEDPFVNGQLYVFQNHIEIVYANSNNYTTVPFSTNVGEMANFVLYVYMLLMNRKVALDDWNDDPSHFQLLRRITGTAQGAILIQPLEVGPSERYEELNVLKKYGTKLRPNSIDFLDPGISTRLNRVNENLVNAFLHFQSDPVWAKSIAKEYFISGKKDLFLGFDRTRVFYSDHWMTAFDGEFVGMQGM